MAQQSKGDAAGLLDGERLRVSEIRTDSVRHPDAHAAILVFSWDSVQPQSVLNRRARLLNRIAQGDGSFGAERGVCGLRLCNGVQSSPPWMSNLVRNRASFRP